MHCSDTYKTAYSDTFASTYMYVSLCIWGRGRVSPCELCHLSTHAYMFFVLFSFLLHYDIYLWPFSLPLAFCGPEGVHVQAKSEDTIRGIVKFVGVNGLQMPHLICCTHTYICICGYHYHSISALTTLFSPTSFALCSVLCTSVSRSPEFFRLKPQSFPGKCHVCLPATGSGLCAPSSATPSWSRSTMVLHSEKKITQNGHLKCTFGNYCLL